MIACCSINMRIFKTAELIILSLSILRSCNAAPAESSLIDASQGSTIKDDLKPSPIGDHYDQRQNGTENYRIHVDGVVLVVAPIEGLLLAAGSIPGVGEDESIFGITSGHQQDKPIVQPMQKPEQTTSIAPTTEPTKEKTSNEKSFQGNGLRLISLLSPYLRRIHRPHA